MQYLFLARDSFCCGGTTRMACGRPCSFSGKFGRESLAGNWNLCGHETLLAKPN
jgi:hypothetical protein